jgi:hypothetical protein
MLAQTPYGGRAADASSRKLTTSEMMSSGTHAVVDGAPVVVQIVDEAIERVQPLISPRSMRAHSFGLDRAPE